MELITNILRDNQNLTLLLKIGEHISDKVATTYDLPQGSILGPTLFQRYRQ